MVFTQEDTERFPNLFVKGITHFSPLFKHNLQCVRKGRESLNGLKENVNVPLSHFPQTQ